MRRIGVITNRTSRRNRGAVPAWPRRVGRVEIVQLVREEGAEVRALLSELARREVELIAVNGGDGTVQKLVTALLAHRPFPEPPPLLLLRGGTANMTAAELGPKGRPARVLARLVRALEREEGLHHRIRERAVLRVQSAGDPAGQRGFFLGALGLLDAVRLCTGSFHRRGILGETSHLLTLLVLLARMLMRGPEAAGLACGELAIAVDGRRWREGRELLLLATTLTRLVLRTRPFWNRQGRALAVTAVACEPPGLLQALPGLLYRGRGPADPAYGSTGAARVTVRGLAQWMLDGEFFTGPREEEVVISADERLGFLWV